MLSVLNKMSKDLLLTLGNSLLLNCKSWEGLCKWQSQQSWGKSHLPQRRAGSDPGEVGSIPHQHPLPDQEESLCPLCWLSWSYLVRKASLCNKHCKRLSQLWSKVSPEDRGRAPLVCRCGITTCYKTALLPFCS